MRSRVALRAGGICRLALLAFGATAVFGFGIGNRAHAGGLVEAGELEHARANARAGGPVSERDRELLERWGCTTGTNNPVCDQHKVRRYRTYEKASQRRRPRH